MREQPVECRGTNCRKMIWWIRNPTTQKMHPWDDKDMKVSHFKTCVDAPAFRAESRQKRLEAEANEGPA